MDVTGIAIVVLAVCLVVALVVRRTARPSMPVVRPVLDAGTVQVVGGLVTRGRRIDAIKALRDATGLGLREAKEWIDGWDVTSTSAVPTTAASAQGPDPAALEVLAIETRAVRQTSGDVVAIKHVRERTGWGLLDAKTYVDRLV